MPIAKGEEWGSAGSLPDDAPIATSDAEAAELVEGTPASELPLIIGLAAGDLARTLGVRAPYDRHATQQLLPVDIVKVRLDDDRSFTCVAHAVIGRPLVDRHVVAVMNAAFVRKHNVAPRGHPGDGKADVVTFRLGLTDRLKAFRRLRTGMHVPHPNIGVQRRAHGLIDLGRRRPVWVDGKRVGHSAHLSFDVLPDALVVAV